MKNNNPTSGAAVLRRRAKERLRTKTAELHPPRTAEAAQRLVHELEVHQIELEMQNEELRQAQENLELSRNKYVGLYAFAPVGYFTFDTRGLIREVNLTGATAGNREGIAAQEVLYQFCRRSGGQGDFFYTPRRGFSKTGQPGL